MEKSAREIELEESIAAREAEIEHMREAHNKIYERGEWYLASMLAHQNALKWIRHLAMLHYLGDAFDPEHMRTIANMAADALSGEGDELPDYDIYIEESREKAKAWVDKVSKVLDRPDDGKYIDD